MKSIIEILQEIRPDIDFSDSDNFVGNSSLDSLDIIRLVSDIESNFNISINNFEIIPENFSNVVAIEKLIQKSKKRS